MNDFIKVILLNVIIFFSVIVIHEASHALVGYCLGCSKINIVFLDFVNGPHTQMSCPNANVNWLLYGGSIIGTVLFGSIFLLFKNPTRNIFFLILGLSLIFGALDLNIIFNTQVVFYMSLLSGFGSMTIGEYFVASNLIDNSY